MIFTTVHHVIPLITINQTCHHLDAAFAKLQNAEEFVSTIEMELDIQECWTASNSEYKTFYQENVLTNYSKALDELEQLVVMQLFELAKMSMSGTGMLKLDTSDPKTNYYRI